MPKSAAKESTRKRILDAARQEIVLGKGDLEVANVQNVRACQMA